MNTEIFEMDYSEEYKKRRKKSESNDTDFLEQLNSNPIIAMIRELDSLLPKTVVEKDKDTYERLLKRCDEMAKIHGGKIYGIVDFENYDSRIVLTLPFFEFFAGHNMDLLNDMAVNTTNVLFRVLPDKNIQLTIYIPYFEEINAEINEEILKELVNKKFRLKEEITKNDIKRLFDPDG